LRPLLLTLENFSMKKTLIAMAAVAAATGAMAQSSVNISGRIDISALNNSKVSTQATPSSATNSTKNSATGADNGWTTSELVFSGTEDLGGGLKAGFTIASSFGATSSVVGSRDVFMRVDGGFGTVRLGKFVPAAAMGYFGYTASATNQAGNLYGVAHSTTASANMDPYNFGGGLTAGSFERNSNQIQYTSPSFNGLVVNVNYGSSKTDKSDAVGNDLARQSGLGVTYTAGPLSVGFGTQDRKREVEVGGTALSNPVTAAGAKVKGDLDWVGGSYNFGVATVSGAHIKRKDKTTTAAGATTTDADIALNTFAVTVPMGAYTFAASTYSGKNKAGTGSADDYKLSGHQLSVRYALSKRTTVYAAMGEAKVKRDGTNTGPAGKRTSNTVGLLHTF